MVRRAGVWGECVCGGGWVSGLCGEEGGGGEISSASSQGVCEWAVSPGAAVAPGPACLRVWCLLAAAYKLGAGQTHGQDAWCQPFQQPPLLAGQG